MDAFHRRFPIGLNRRAGPGDQRLRGYRNIAVEQVVINVSGGEHLLVVEEVAARLNSSAFSGT
jgi:hypothetical protein